MKGTSIMVVFFTGLVLFILGAILAIVARSQEARQTAGAEEPFFGWFLGVLRESFPILVGAGHGIWERVAALGTILSALGVLTAIAGLIAWAV